MGMAEAAARRPAELHVRAVFLPGMVSGQARLLHAAGVPAEDALAATSWDARAFLGLPGIQAGAPADFVVYASDPRTDLETLHHPELIVLDGRVIPART